MPRNNPVVVALAAFFIQSVACGERPGAGAAGAEKAEGALDYPRGPHGARLLTGDELQLEVTIFETGVPPHFRVYPLDARGNQVAPGDVRLSFELHRLGGRVDKFAFVPEADYLRGEGVVEEPHSFDVKVKGERAGRIKEWSYSQIEGKVQLGDDVLKSTGIEIREVGPRSMTTVLELPGEIVADETRVAHVVARVPGVVTDVFKKSGDAVTRGELMAVLDSRELADARSAYMVAVDQTKFLRIAAEREESLWKKKISAEREYLAARRDFEQAQLGERVAAQKLVALGEKVATVQALPNAAVERLARFEINAPLGGVVLERDLAVGEAIPAGHPAFKVADLSSVWVQAQVPARDLVNVRRGQTARIQSKDLGREIAGRVTYVGSIVGQDSRSAPARIVIPNPDGQWRPGLFVSVQLVQQTATATLAVPQEAIQTFRDWQVVFVRYGDWFEARPLGLGRSDGGWVEVLSGLSPGERYAATNSFAIKAEIGKLGASHDH